MRLVRVTAAVIVGAGVLAGCSGGETANETLPSASSTAAETTATLPPLGPPDLPMPAAAREQTPAGAKAFSEYYIALINRLEVQLDSAPLRNFSRSCSDCERIATDADNDRKAGYSYQGGTLTLSSVGEAAVKDQHAELAFVANQAELQVVDSTGAAVADLAAPELTNLPGGCSLQWVGDHWLVTSLSFG